MEGGGRGGAQMACRWWCARAGRWWRSGQRRESGRRRGLWHLLETQMGEKPEWRKSNPGREVESQSAVSHVIQDTNTQTGTTTLGRVAVVDSQPHTACCLTLEAQHTVADAAETGVVDHGSHNVDVDIPIKGHL